MTQLLKTIDDAPLLCFSILNYLNQDTSKVFPRHRSDLLAVMEMLSLQAQKIWHEPHYREVTQNVLVCFTFIVEQLKLGWSFLAGKKASDPDVLIFQRERSNYDLGKLIESLIVVLFGPGFEHLCHWGWSGNDTLLLYVHKNHVKAIDTFLRFGLYPMSVSQ